MKDRFNILHLDDNSQFTYVIGTILEELKEHNVYYESVHNRKEAIDKLKASKFHLYIGDLMLEDDHNADPGVNLIKDINKEYPELKIMVLSSRTDNSLRNKLKPYIAEYVTKDFRPSTFPDKVLSALGIN
jgi:DNA-binding NarL/FixJ family response regulator